MLSKKQLLLKSIRELLALNVSDQEILLNLKEVGIERAQARKLVQEAKNPEKPPLQETAAEQFIEKFDHNKSSVTKKNSVKEKTEAIKEEREEATEELATEEISTQALEETSKEEVRKTLDEIARQVSGDAPEETAFSDVLEKPVSKPLFEKRAPIKMPFEKNPKPLLKTKPITTKPVLKSSSNLVEDVMVSKLWEKGIMGIVSQRLEEMKNLKENLDVLLDEKVQAASKREMDKIKVLFDSQRVLMVTKVDTEIENKANGYVSIIESKLREMKGIQERINMQINELKKAEQKNDMAEAALSKRLSELGHLKEQLVSSLNTELIKTKTQNKQLLEEMNAKLSEMDDRINKTLQLENQIVEGLVKEAEQTVQKMLKEEAGELAKINDVKIDELKKVRSGFDQEQEKRLDLFEKEQREKLEKMQEELKNNTGETSTRLKEHMALLGTQLKARLEKLGELEKAITHEFRPEKFRRQMKELEEFKAQFLDAIQENTSSFNQGMKRLNQQNQVIEKQFALRAEKIDQKIAELDAFEKNFAKEMGLTIEKLVKKPGKK